MVGEGLEHWILIPLDRLPCAIAQRRERFWMRRVGGIWNKYSGKWRSARWRCLRGPLRGMNKGERSTLIADAHSVIQSQRRVFRLKHEMWLLRHGEDCLEPRVYTRLLHRIRVHERPEVGVHLPSHIPIPYAMSNHVDLTALKQMTQQVLTALKLPPCVVSYLETVIRFVGKRGPTVSDALRQKQPQENWSEMKRIAKGSCDGHSLPPEVTRVEGCCIVRDRPGLMALLGEYAHALDQNVTNSTIAPWYQVERALAQPRRAFNHLRGSKDGTRWAFHGLTAELKQMYDTTVFRLPWCLRGDTLTEMRDLYNPRYVFLPLDKNGGKMVCMCRTLYYHRLLAIYEDKSQFTTVHTCESHEV